MAQILDKQGLQHYANKMCNADNRKVGSKSLPTALNEIDIAIDGFKTLFESEYGTPVNMELENNKNAFSIGTGINIDKKDDVENSFTDIKLSGNSIVNCIKENSFKNANNFIDHENNPIITDTSITLKSIGGAGNYTRFSPKLDCGIIKPDTTYTFVFNVLENTLSGTAHLLHTNINNTISPFSIEKVCNAKKTGIFKYVITTPSSLSKCTALFRTLVWNDNQANEIIKFNVMILEGDYSNKSILNYFEGLKSIGEKEDGNHKISISSVGKNLLPIPDCFVKNSEDKILINVPSKYDNIARSMNCKKVILSAYVKGENIQPIEGASCHYGLDISLKGYGSQLSSSLIWISLIKGILPQSGSFEGWYHKEVTFQNTTTITGLNKVNLFLRNMTGKLSMSNIQLEIVDAPQTKPTHYQPYVLDKKEISLNEPLRGLPNGVKDTVEKINGEWKIIRRCVQIDLDGTEYWNHENPSQEDGVNTTLFVSNEILNAKDFPKICDRFIAKSSNLMLNSHPDSEGVGC